MTASNGVPSDNARDLVDDLQAHVEHCQKAIDALLRYPGIREYVGLNIYMQLQDCLHPPVSGVTIKKCLENMLKLNNTITQQQIFIREQYQAIEELTSKLDQFQSTLSNK